MSAVVILLACAAPDPDLPRDSELGDSTLGDSSSDSSPDSGEPSSELSWTAVSAEGGASGADLAVAPDGELYASWVRSGHAWVSTSVDGTNWSEPVVVNSSGSASVYGASHPELVVDDDRVIVSMSAGERQVVYGSSRTALDFAELAVIGEGRGDLHFEGIFLRAHLAPDGSVWATYHAFPAGSWDNGWKGIARETADWELEPVSTGAPGVPCECCAHDLLFTQNSDVVFAWRNNEDDIRDMYAASGHAGFDSWTAAGDVHPVINYCPVQGPRLAEEPGGELLMIWADGVEGEYETFLATSTDGGESWSPSSAVLSELEGQRASPNMAVAPDGRALLGWTSPTDESGLAWRSGGEWAGLGDLEREGVALSYPELVAGEGFFGGIAADDSGDVWLFQLP